MTDPAYDALTTYIEETSEISPALRDARADAAEFGLDVPDEVTGQLLSTLAAAGGREGSGAVAVTPAAAVVGLYLLAGLPAKSTRRPHTTTRPSASSGRPATPGPGCASCRPTRWT